VQSKRHAACSSSPVFSVALLRVRTHAAAAAAANVMPFSDLSSDNDSVDGPPPNADASTLLSSPPGPAMPASLTSASSLVQPGEGNEWRVRAGEDLPSFLFANGPGRITRYNFTVVSERTWSDRVIRHVRGAKPGYSDIFELTPDGRRMHGTLLGWRLELACTGESMYSNALVVRASGNAKSFVAVGADTLAVLCAWSFKQRWRTWLRRALRLLYPASTFRVPCRWYLHHSTV
jgi:hypothetical protein